MSVHKPIDNSSIYFITFTCYKWLKLIDITQAYDEVYKFFSVLQKQDHTVLGYTIMPNHVHLLLFFNKQAQSLNTVTGNGKRFMGYEITKRLQKQNETAILALMEQGVIDAESKRNKKHEIWQGTFDVKECYGEKFILQKLNYMHQNPCTERWKLCKEPVDYEHSSALFYEVGMQGKFIIRDYRDFLSVLLDLEEQQRVQTDESSEPAHRAWTETHRETEFYASVIGQHAVAQFGNAALQRAAVQSNTTIPQVAGQKGQQVVAQSEKLLQQPVGQISQQLVDDLPPAFNNVPWGHHLQIITKPSKEIRRGRERKSISIRSLRAA